MARNPFQHIDLRVNDVDKVKPFYAVLLPALGFERAHAGKLFHTWAAPGIPPSQPWFGITEKADHVPDESRIAFWAESPQEVDRLAAIAREAGAQAISGPRACPEYAQSYYACFFDDPCGNKLEICYIAE